MIAISKIEEIEKGLISNRKSIELIGVSDGILGLALFYYYHYLFTNNENSFEKIIVFLEEALNKINENYKSHKVQLEIIEIGLFLIFLNEKDILDNEQTEYFLTQLDDIIEDYLLKKITEKDLDYTVGLLKAGYYFVKRNNPTKKDLLYKCLDVIKDLSITDNDLTYWKFPLRNQDNPKIELGLGHGVAGVILFLLQLYHIDFEKEQCLRILETGIKFILSQKKTEGITWFANNAFDDEVIEYNNLSYGDIGIGYVLYKAGVILKSDIYKQEGLLILENASKFRDENRVYIKDANIIYGAAGLYSVFNFIYQLTQVNIFLETSDYWYNKIFDFGNEDQEKKWAGFNTYFNGDYEFAQLGFSQGIAGIGIAIISKEMVQNNDYLNLLNYN